MHNGKVLQINPEITINRNNEIINVTGAVEQTIVTLATTEVRNLETDKIALKTTVGGVQTNKSVEQSIVTIREPGVEIQDCDKVIIRTSYRGPQGARGETSTFNDLEIPSLRARFLARLA